MRDQPLHKPRALLQLRHLHEFVRRSACADRARADHHGRDISHAGEQARLGAEGDLGMVVAPRKALGERDDRGVGGGVERGIVEDLLEIDAAIRMPCLHRRL